MFLCEHSFHARFIRFFYFGVWNLEVKKHNTVRQPLHLNQRLPRLYFYNGGGTAPKNRAIAGTLFAAAQAGIPCVQTNVSGVSCPC